MFLLYHGLNFVNINFQKEGFLGVTTNSARMHKKLEKKIIDSKDASAK